MSFPRFFIARPIFAVVLSVLFVIAGLAALLRLPLSEYPAVTPPTVQVTATYPGAGPEVIAETVATPLEQAINGVEGMIYMQSQAATDGRLTLTVTFAQDTDPDLAQIQVQNRVQRALPRLPADVQRLGITTQKSSPDLLMVVHMLAPDGRHSPLDVSNYAIAQVRDELARLPGVADVPVWGAGEYAMRVWLDPGKVAARGLTAGDIVAAIREQNVEVAAGAIGQSPDARSAFQVAIDTRGRLQTEEEFGAIVVKTGANGDVTRLHDVARIELGADRYALRSLLDGQPAVALQIIQDPGANALEVAASVRATMARLAKQFPAGISHRIAYDPTIFVRASLGAVGSTLVEALLLVVVVVMLFLQRWRAALIPLLAVPVSLIGTLAVMQGLGFSLNTLSLFGLVLSIGIVVDDAIVVVENVERHIGLGATPTDAARRAMDEVTGPIIAITAVLAAVFIPTAFLPGLQGEFYRQFALTIAISTILSGLNSLTLSPALAGVLLQAHGARRDALQRRIDAGLGWLFAPFNRLFDRGGQRYAGSVKRITRAATIAGIVYGGLIGLTALGLARLPNGFVPAQDKYYLVGVVQLPNGASLDRTTDVAREVTRIALAEPGVESVVAFPGLSINGFVNVPNAAVVFAMLDPFEQRRGADMTAGAIAGRLQAKVAQIPDGFIGLFPPPPVPGLGATGGFKLQIEDRNGAGLEALSAATGKLLQAAAREPALAGLMTSFNVASPELAVEVNRDKAKAQGVAITSVFEAMQVYLGSLYVNDFNRSGRTYQVFVQAEASERTQLDAIDRLHVRAADGAMVPLATLVDTRSSAGPDRVIRYNGYASADVTGGPAPGYSSGQAVAAMERLAAETLPAGMSVEWTDLTYQEKAAGYAALYIFPLAVLMAFLILAALYNSWALPLAVILIVPMCLLGGLAGVWLSGGDINIFTQIGFVVLIGLAAKNAILIVEFARDAERHDGLDPVAAAIKACRLRLRPILMTSIAFTAGVIPLVLASGAGAEMRHAMGIAVFAGMLGVTLFGLFFTPLFYVVIRRLVLARAKRRRGTTATTEALA